MLLPLVTESALRLPNFATSFYKLIYIVSDVVHEVKSRAFCGAISAFSPQVIINLNNELKSQLMQCLSWAITGAAGAEPMQAVLETTSTLERTLAKLPKAKQDSHVHALREMLKIVSQ